MSCAIGEGCGDKTRTQRRCATAVTRQCCAHGSCLSRLGNAVCQWETSLLLAWMLTSTIGGSKTFVLAVQRQCVSPRVLANLTPERTGVAVGRCLALQLLQSSQTTQTPACSCASRGHGKQCKLKLTETIRNTLRSCAWLQ